MRNKLWFIACCAVAIVCLCIMSSCELTGDEPLIGGDPLSKDNVTENNGSWTVEEITEGKAGEYNEKDSGMVSEGKLFFYHTKSEALLIDSTGSLTWLYSENKNIFDGFDTGDYVKVSHGYVMESYPAQTYISRIALVEDGDVSSLTDEDWDKLEGVFPDFERGEAAKSIGAVTVYRWSPDEITESDVVDNDSGAVSEGRLYFVGSKDKAMLLSDDGVITWLYSKDKTVFEPFDTGDRVRVAHGAVMMSYPGQTNISKLALIENGHISSFTDEELARLDAVSDGFN